GLGRTTGATSSPGFATASAPVSYTTGSSKLSRCAGGCSRRRGWSSDTTTRTNCGMNSGCGGAAANAHDPARSTLFNLQNQPIRIPQEEAFAHLIVRIIGRVESGPKGVPVALRHAKSKVMNRAPAWNGRVGHLRNLDQLNNVTPADVA